MAYKTPFPTPSLELAAADFRPPAPPLPVLDDELAAMAEELFEAAIDLTKWTGWLKKLAAMFEATGAHVALYDFEKGHILLHALAAQDFEWPAGEVSIYEDLTPTDARASLCAMFPGRAITHQDFDADKVAQEAVIQMAPVELAQMMLVNDVSDPFWGFFSVLKHRDAPHFTEQQRARMTALGPAFQRAMVILRASQGSHAGLEATRDLIRAMHAPIGLFDAEGSLIAFNDRASALLQSEPGLDLASFAARQSAWPRAFERAKADGASGLTVISQGQALAARLVKLPGNPCHYMLELDVDLDGLTARTDRFCAHYGLSVAERAVVELLAAGMPVDMIADRRNTSYETVRSQLRSVREKSGHASQEDIVRALLHFTNRLEAVA